MHQVIGNEKTLKEWLEQSTFQTEVLKANHVILKRLSEVVRTLDEYYGADRDLEKDLGGYTVILYGTQKEIADSHGMLMKYHNLNEEEYEYEDSYGIQEWGIKIVFRLYLCSNDYGIEEVIMEKMIIEK